MQAVILYLFSVTTVLLNGAGKKIKSFLTALNFECSGNAAVEEKLISRGMW